MVFKSIRKNQTFKQASKRFTRVSNRLKPFWQKHQLRILTLIGIVTFIGIISSQFIKAEETIETPEQQPVNVQTYQLNQATNYQTLQAIVESKSSTTLVALTPGPVAQIYLSVGDSVTRGQTILRQSSNYNGASQTSIARQLAEKGLASAETSMRNTSEVVAKNRQLADLNRDNSEKLADISNQSLGETSELIDLITEQISALESQIEQTADAQTKQTLKAQLIPLKASHNQAQAGFRNAKYAADENQAPAGLRQLSRDTVYLQTELQLEMSRINKEVAELNLQSAKIAESLSRTSTPFAGIVEAIYVNPGDYLNPGMPVARISSNNTKVSLKAQISGDLSRLLQASEYVLINLDETEYRLPINHVSTVPVRGSLYQINVDLPSNLVDMVIPGQTLPIQIPLRSSAQNANQILVPITGTYITSTESFVYVLDGDRAVTKTVELGQIIGDRVEIISGLIGDETIIVSRNVAENQLVSIN